MLDSDVAMIYHYKTKEINKTVKRNIERFPENFCFQLTEEERWFQFRTTSINTNNNLRFKSGTSSLENENWSQSGTTYVDEREKYRSKKYLPYVFTEQGIAMLSGLLRNEIAVKVSINIMNAFVEMRRFLYNNGQVFSRLTTVEYRLLEHDKKFEQVFNEFQKNNKEEFKQKIFFDGQIYESYNLVINLIKRAREKILIIDNYIDDTILEMLSKKNKKC